MGISAREMFDLEAARHKREKFTIGEAYSEAADIANYVRSMTEQFTFELGRRRSPGGIALALRSLIHYFRLAAKF